MTASSIYLRRGSAVVRNIRCTVTATTRVAIIHHRVVVRCTGDAAAVLNATSGAVMITRVREGVSSVNSGLLDASRVVAGTSCSSVISIVLAGCLWPGRPAVGGSNLIGLAEIPR
jgi:hypothetical protein